MHSDVDLMETLTPSRQAWRRAIEDPSLHDLPYRIETNEYGQLVMSPLKYRDSLYAGEIVRMLRELAPVPGRMLVAVGVDTPKGVKVPDVSWMTEERSRQLPLDADAITLAPEICVEVLSSSNTQAELREKRHLYFAVGAEEFWTCSEEGHMKFFDANGEMPSSRLVPEFPKRIE